MVEIELCRALRAFIEDAVKDLQLPVEPTAEQIQNGEAEKASEDEYVFRRTPKVINGYLPPKRSQQVQDFPFIVVRPDEGDSDRESTRVTVSIIFGAYSQSGDGYEHCLNMMARVRNALMSMPFQTLDERYQLRDDISWQNFPDQPCPYWQIDMKTHWQVQAPQPLSGIEDM